MHGYNIQNTQVILLKYTRYIFILHTNNFHKAQVVLSDYTTAIPIQHQKTTGIRRKIRGLWSLSQVILEHRIISAPITNAKLTYHVPHTVG